MELLKLMTCSVGIFLVLNLREKKQEEIKSYRQLRSQEMKISDYALGSVNISSYLSQL